MGSYFFLPFCHSKTYDIGINCSFLSLQEWNKKARENPVKENVCKCGKIFKREKDVKFHSKRCRDSACKECGKVFKDAILLQKHVKVHFPDTTNTCTVCDKVFRSKQALRRHEVVHDAAKKIACIFCNQTFSTKGSLNRHNKNIHK